jgi:hypothetical protein
LSTAVVAYADGATSAVDCAALHWLVLPPAATGMRCHLGNGTPEASGDLREVYPATTSLATISTGLKAAGWKPLREDFLNPGVLSSHVRGWAFFQDGTVSPEQDVHQWLADWEDQQLNLVVYAIQYRTARDQPIGDQPGRLSAKYLPCAMVEQLLHQAKILPKDRRRCPAQ